MTVSTLTFTPEPHTGPGAEASAEQVNPLTRDLIDRTTRDDYDQWLSRTSSARGCSHPVRLTGEVHTVDITTGEIRDSMHTSNRPDGVLYVPCGTRRASVCPACAETYRRDAYHLIRSGLAGGKGVPDTIRTHAVVFATFTAPSFGLVHTQPTSPNGGRRACRPRRKPQICPHGKDLRCHRYHKDGEACLGKPLCPDCYDYAAAVVWNAHAPELWRRTMINVRRELERHAKTNDTRVRLSYAKVAEFQTRGVIHYHAILRIDGHNPDDPAQILPPPTCVSVEFLAAAIEDAFTGTHFATVDHPARPGGWDITWGDPTKGLHIRPVTTGIDGDITDTKVAGYLAKYATKATEAVGGTSARITASNLDIYASPRTHHGRLIRAAWRLGNHPHDDFKALRRWAHMLGFRGHFATKTRRYSTTFKALRKARADWQRRQARQRLNEHDDTEETTLVVGLLTYAGTGWHTTADAQLALTAAAKAREYEQTAREENTAMI